MPTTIRPVPAMSITPTLSAFGFGRTNLVYDYKNARHVVLQTRNIFESINVKEANDMKAALDNGCKLTVIDIRANLSAMKADRFFLVRPGTDYALNLAVIHELLTKKLYDEASRPNGSKTSMNWRRLLQRPTPRSGPRPKPASTPTVDWPGTWPRPHPQ